MVDLDDRLQAVLDGYAKFLRDNLDQLLVKECPSEPVSILARHVEGSPIGKSTKQAWRQNITSAHNRKRKSIHFCEAATLRIAKPDLIPDATTSRGLAGDCVAPSAKSTKIENEDLTPYDPFVIFAPFVVKETVRSLRPLR